MRGKGIIKVVLSAAMLALVLRVVDLGTLRQTIASIPPLVALGAIVGFSLTQMVNCLKWWLILRAGGINVSYLAALRVVFVGMFANCFGFGTLGGDMLRGVLISQGLPKKTEAVASVFADRALGLAILSLLGVIATAFIGGHHMEPLFVYTLCGVASCIFLGWFLGPLLVLKLVQPGNRFRTKVEQLTAVLPKNPRTLALVCSISAFFHLSQITLHWVIAWGLGIKAALASFLVTVPFINILSTLPLSWNGVGIRENAYLFFLSPEVLSKEQVIAFGALWLLAITGSSLIGGLIAVWTGDIRFLRSKNQSIHPEGAVHSD
jgi:uncharacterized membrane protein YbhN (UPF0104 family)